jgi:hypothetical protein
VQHAPTPPENCWWTAVPARTKGLAASPEHPALLQGRARHTESGANHPSLEQGPFSRGEPIARRPPWNHHAINHALNPGVHQRSGTRWARFNCGKQPAVHDAGASRSACCRMPGCALSAADPTGTSPASCALRRSQSLLHLSPHRGAPGTAAGRVIRRKQRPDSSLRTF